MKLSNLQLGAFTALARARNFTSAAKKIGISQSALSQRIFNLEDEIQTTLFIREPSGVRLTDAAEGLLRYCLLSESAESEILNRLKPQSENQLGGVVRVGGFSSVVRSLVIPSLKGLIRSNSRLQLQVITREMRELPRMLKSGEVDFILLDHVIEHQELLHHALGEEKNVLVEKKGYRGAEIFLDHDEEDQTTVQYLKKFAKASAKQPLRHYLDDIYGIIDGVKQGFGRAVLPLHLIQGETDLHIVTPKNVMKTPIFLHYYRQPYYSKLHESVAKSLLSIKNID